jgi:hypothetical protein
LQNDLKALEFWGKWMANVSSSLQEQKTQKSIMNTK